MALIGKSNKDPKCLVLRDKEEEGESAALSLSPISYKPSSTLKADLGWLRNRLEEHPLNAWYASCQAHTLTNSHNMPSIETCRHRGLSLAKNQPYITYKQIKQFSWFNYTEKI